MLFLQVTNKIKETQDQTEKPIVQPITNFHFRGTVYIKKKKKKARERGSRLHVWVLLFYLG